MNAKYDYKTDFDTLPVTDSEEELINLYFKQCYYQKVIDYAENSPVHKKKRLFEMLESITEDRPKTAPSFKTDVAFTLNGGFGLSYNFLGKRSSKKVNPMRFSSPGIMDNGIFGYPQIESQITRSMKISQTKSSAQTHMLVTRFIKPEKVSDVVNIADQFSSVWYDLSKEVGSGRCSSSMQATQASVNFVNPQSPFPKQSPYAPQSSISGTKSREFKCESPRRGGEFSLRLKDNTLRDLYKSDRRWAPRITPKKE